MLTSATGNSYFTGVQSSTTPYAPQVLSANALTALTVQTTGLSATNVPIVGTTIVATLPASWYKTQYFTTVAKTAATGPFGFVDLNGTPIQLPLNIAATATTAPVNFYLTECLINLNAFGPANTTWTNATAQSISLGTTNAAGTATIAHTMNWTVRPDGTGGAPGIPMATGGGTILFADASSTAVATLTTAIAFNNAIGISSTDGTGAPGGGFSDEGATGQLAAGAAGTFSSLPGWSNLSYVLNPATAAASSYFGAFLTAQSTANSTINAQGNFAVGRLFVYLSYVQVNPQPTGQFLYTNPTTLYPGIF